MTNTPRTPIRPDAHTLHAAAGPAHLACGETHRLTPQGAQLVAALCSATPAAAVDELQRRSPIPELAALAELSEGHGATLHKNNYVHSLRVVEQCGPDAPLRVRLAALFHDAGKPATRRISGTKVTFHGHETVGEKLTTKRLLGYGFDNEYVTQVCAVIDAAGRVQSYLRTWTDAAVRRTAARIGPVFDDAVTLAKADCTTRHDHKRRRLWSNIDDFCRRASEIAASDELAAQRPAISGDDLIGAGLTPGPVFAQVLAWVLERNRSGELLDPRDALTAALRYAEDLTT